MEWLLILFLSTDNIRQLGPFKTMTACVTTGNVIVEQYDERDVRSVRHKPLVVIGCFPTDDMGQYVKPVIIEEE